MVKIRYLYNNIYLGNVEQGCLRNAFKRTIVSLSAITYMILSFTIGLYRFTNFTLHLYSCLKHIHQICESKLNVTHKKHSARARMNVLMSVLRLVTVISRHESIVSKETKE